MATALALDVASHRVEVSPIAMDPVTDVDIHPSSRCPIPNPVSIPPRYKDLSDKAPHVGSTSSSPQASPHLHEPPLPMPDFVFPARPSTSAPSSFSRATGRRPKSVADLEERGNSLVSNDKSLNRKSCSPALPDFVFNPGATLPVPPSHPFLSPPQSPQSARPIPTRPSGSGHRRGGSEFVGGNLRSGDAFTVMGTSPTKSDSGLSSPALAPLNTRRGHAHRRSAAISSHDLSAILQPSSPNPPVRGSSAPSSPAEFKFPVTTGDKENTSSDISPSATSGHASQPTFADASLSTADPLPTPPSSSRTVNRARVGFSDTLEFIPRPLSLVSSDTSSTITARPAVGSGNGHGNHSVSGSISSIISLSSPTAAATRRETASPVSRSPFCDAGTDSRPSTANAILEGNMDPLPDNIAAMSPKRRNSIPVLTSIPSAKADQVGQDATPALSSPSKSSKRWSFFSLDPFLGNGSSSSLVRSQTAGTGSSEDMEVTPPAGPSSLIPSDPVVVHSDAAAAAPTQEGQPPQIQAQAKPIVRKASNKKKKKVRTWGILRKRSKARRKSRRAPTPPPVVRRLGAEASNSAAGASSESLTAPAVFVTPTESSNESGDIEPLWEVTGPSTYPVQDDDTSLAMIDLDAALGPFNTPLPRNPEWEAAQRAGGLSKRQLHSAAGMSRFTGPGMHYSHRRAESAPEMPPFNRAGIPRFGSSTAMADVFEEDEEDEDDNANETQTKVRPADTATSSVHSTSSAVSTPAQHGADYRPPDSIGIRITPTESYDDVSGDKLLDIVAVSDDATSSAALSRRGSGLSGLSDDDKTQPSTGLKSEYSASSLHDDVIMEGGASHAFLSGANENCDTTIESSSDSTVNSPGRLMKGKNLAPVDVSPLHLPSTSALAPPSPYSMTPSSALPSPRSPFSYDANRMSTAPSSVTEDNLQSLLLGEPGPEVRLSSDMPSLTSSNSTMTRDSANMQGPQPRPYLPSRGTERPASFTSTAFGRRRSSLASLHRLINSSHGERSKLAIEIQPDSNNNDSSSTSIASSDPEKRAAKSSRTKRLSRLMQFWKPKEESAL